jgi:hypothetical protein
VSETGPRQESGTQQHLPGSPVASTGDAQVDAALTALQGLEELPAAEQADVIEEVHDRLRSTLAGLDSAAPSGVPNAGDPVEADEATEPAASAQDPA